jgi:hypothetical protein
MQQDRKYDNNIINSRKIIIYYYERLKASIIKYSEE